MKKLLLLAIMVFGGFQAWQKFNHTPLDPLYDEPYIAVYGRNSCGFTQNMLSKLKKQGFSYRYFIVDDQQVANSLHARMESSGLSTRRYNLPVVDVNGKLMIRPVLGEVLSEY